MSLIIRARKAMLFLAGCVGQDLFLMRMKPIFSTSRNQSDTKKPDDDWQEQFFKLDVQYIVSQQVNWLPAQRIHAPTPSV